MKKERRKRELILYFKKSILKTLYSTVVLNNGMFTLMALREIIFCNDVEKRMGGKKRDRETETETE